MRLMILLLAVAGLASAQTMIEYSAAAAGGSAAGVAGKTVSNGLDKVFQSVNGLAKSAAKSAPAKSPHVEPQAPAPGDMGTPAMAPARTSHYATATRRYTSTRSSAPVLPRRVESFDGQAVSPYVAQLVLPAVTPLDIAGVKAGIRAEDLTLQVGRPAARVLIPDGNRLVEILTYTSREGYAGSVKLSDGQVVDVKPAGKGTR